MPIYGNILNENTIKNISDIYYNKDKFDSGEINLCFITGHSGSGKSTMGKDMSNDKSVEHYELDDVLSNAIYFTMNDFKEYGDLIYSFFKGTGKKYFFTSEDIDEGKAEPYLGDYDKDIINDFVSYSIAYANSHKNKKYVIEGIWLYVYIKPELLKDYAVYIKGTSTLISNMRAAKRDSKNDFPDKDKDKIARTKAYVNRLKLFFNKTTREDEKTIQKYRNYFSNLIKKIN